VITHDSPEFIKSPEEWIPIEGSVEAIARANRKGYRVVVTSNQSGLARGLFDIGTLNKIHARMLQQVARCNGRIDAIFFCPHAPSDDCACRKPRVGLLRDLGERLGTDLANATFVGDRASDVQAANAIGAKPILVKTGYGRKTLAGSVDLSMVSVYDDLSAAVEQLA
jgi:D-glycero-D-manno-heptose 1,7-bisphosphate phosphatase